MGRFAAFFEGFGGSAAAILGTLAATIRHERAVKNTGSKLTPLRDFRVGNCWLPMLSMLPAPLNLCRFSVILLLTWREQITMVRSRAEILPGGRMWV
jgi:hypothetical protein